MFGLFKKQSRLEKLQSRYAKLMEEAMLIQRNGDVRAAAEKTAEADALLKEIEQLESVQQQL